MVNGIVWHEGENTSSLFHDIKIPISKRVLEHWGKCHQSQSRRETEVNFYSNLVIWVTLALCGSWHPQGRNVLRFNRQTLLLKQTGLDTFYSNPKTPPRPAHHFSLAPTYLWLESVCLSASISGCLFAWHLSGLAKFCLDLISHREDLRRPSRHLALWISANSVPVSAVRDWRTPTQSSLQDLLGNGSASPSSRQPHLHVHKSLLELMVSQTRHDTTLSHKIPRAKLQCDSVLC